MADLTIKDVQKALPEQMQFKVSQDMVDELNSLSNDPQHAQIMRDNFISFSKIMTEGRFKLDDYVCAVIYSSYKIMGYNNKESYAMTFPTRYQNLVAKGASEKDISAYTSAYNKNKLVNLILEQAMIPSWVLNQDIFQKAINTQAELMVSARSEKVRSDAANSLLQHLKKPETKKVELELGLKQNDGMDDLRAKLVDLAETQQKLIQSGMSTKEIAHDKLVQNRDIEDAEIV